MRLSLYRRLEFLRWFACQLSRLDFHPMQIICWIRTGFLPVVFIEGGVYSQWPLFYSSVLFPSTIKDVSSILSRSMHEYWVFMRLRQVGRS